MLPSRSFALPPNFGANGKPTSLQTEGQISLTQYKDVDEDGINDVVETTVSAPIRPYGSAIYKDQQYTTDGGAGGVELLDWYESHPGSFFVYLSYDKYSNFGKDNAGYQNLSKYNQVVEVFFSDFSHSVIKRGVHDFWNISVTLEEV
jgi:hypothetical protein